MNRGASMERASGSFWHGLHVQLRVIGALLMREIITRYGRHNIGFLWLLLEPIIFTLGVVILWHFVHRLNDLHIEVTPFIVTGYSTLLMWRNCASRGIKAIEPNRSLLHHRPVKIQDIFIARMILEVAGVTASFILVIITMIALNQMAVPRDIFLLATGWLFIAWFSACLGTILGCLSEYSELVERLWHPGGYFLLAVSGTFFMVDWLPSKLQKLVLWVPIVNPVEMIRAGYWGNSMRFHYSIAYIFVVCISMSLIALLLMADRRMKQLA
jgi:capsular polysaccharide transport system permease protein